MSLSTTHPCWWLPWLLGVPSTLALLMMMPVSGCDHLGQVIMMVLLIIMMIVLASRSSGNSSRNGIDAFSDTRKI